MILVVGAARWVGRSGSGASRRPRAWAAHKPEQSDRVRAAGAAEAAVGDLRDLASLEAVFYVAPAFLPDEGGVGRRVVETAVRAGARRLLFSAVIHPALTELTDHATKIPVEAVVLDSWMEYRFIHPALYFQNWL